MALNKAHTSVGVKVLIIVLIAAFVSLFMYQGFAGLFQLFQPSESTSASTTTVDQVAALSQEYQPQVDSLKQTIASDPTSYTPQVELANTYFDWAQALSQPAQGQSQLTTAAMSAAFTAWGQAKAAYDSASKLTKALDPGVQTDRSYAALNANETTEAIAIVKVVTAKAPTFAQAWAHLGIYYEASGQSKLAIPAYQKFLTLASTQDTQTISYVKGRLQAISSSTATKTP